MNTISVKDARDFADLLNTSADNAEAKGADSFDLSAEAASRYANARAAAQLALDGTPTDPSAHRKYVP